jgi:cation-transporting ATPase E
VTILVLCHLALLPFIKPPHRIWVGGEPFSGDWRYTIASVVLLGVLIVTLMSPPLRQFYELAALGWQDILFLLLVTAEWSLILRIMWRTRLLDHFLGINLR